MYIHKSAAGSDELEEPPMVGKRAPFPCPSRGSLWRFLADLCRFRSLTARTWKDCVDI